MCKFCPTCEDYCEIETDTIQEAYKVRGMPIEVSVTREVCVSCGERLGSEEQDQQILDTINSEYRKQVDLLAPERIREIRSKYNLSQKSFALLLGMSEATINRYENGALQDQSHDTTIRACEEPRFVSELLERRGNLLTKWQRDRVSQALSGQPISGSLVFISSGLGMPDELSDHTGFRHFDYDRFAYVAIHLCEAMGQISRTVINKLLFYADFLNFKTATVSLTGAAYRRLDYGPVPADYSGLLAKMESEELVAIEEKVFSDECTGYYYKPGPQSNSIQVQLSKHEEKVLGFIVKEFEHCTARQISERSHKESAWLNTKDRDLISYLEAQSLTLDMPD